MNNLNQFQDPEVDRLGVNVAMMKEMNITHLTGNFILFIVTFWWLLLPNEDKTFMLKILFVAILNIIFFFFFIDT